MSAVKLIVMGVGGVGKSALTVRFCDGSWVERYDPTIEDKHTTDMEVDGRAISIEILDTAGQEQYSALRETFMHTGDGFVLVYSITDDSTFEDLSKIRKQILDVHPDRYVPFLLLGNKCDLESERAVTQEEAKKRAAEFNEAQFIEASAKTNKNVREAFELILRTILKRSSDPTKGGGGGTVMGAGQAPRAPAPAEPKKKNPCVLL